MPSNLLLLTLDRTKTAVTIKHENYLLRVAAKTAEFH